MNDGELAVHTVLAQETELAARAHMAAAGDDRQEQDAARAVLRQAVVLRQQLENWIVMRATRERRAQRAQTAVAR